MVEFTKLIKKSTPVDATDLVALFESGDRHTSHTELRPAQQQALEALSNRHGERDLILKVSTGAGKTAVGLLYLQSHMVTSREPVVYLCPTVQLVEQVCGEADRLGLVALPYPKGQPIPPVDGTRGQAIIVCTYDKLFNGRSTFDRDDVQLRPCAMVLDDAHSGIDKIRDNFRLLLEAGDGDYEQLLTILDPACSKAMPGPWAKIREQEPHSSMEVPFWTWTSVLEDVRQLLSNPTAGTHNWFAWPLVCDCLRWCRCVLSNRGAEIVPLVLPVEWCRAFAACKHRLFMSASLANDATLVRDLGCDPGAVDSVITSPADKGLGERMVLAPSLIDPSLNRTWLIGICANLSKRVNVVVLCPSEVAAKDWVKAGAEVVTGEQTAGAVRALRGSKRGHFVVLPQRYDGVDLPDDACRVLVLDGIPTGESITDSHDASLEDAVRRRLVHRIEQGMGRAVRSHVDYAVVILAGNSLANFIARAPVLAIMNPDTRAQLELALYLAKLAQDEDKTPEESFVGLIRQCLGRDEGWKQYYNETVRESDGTAAEATSAGATAVAAALRQTFTQALGNDAAGAAVSLQGALDTHLTDRSEKAVFLQQVANYTYESNEGKAFEIQRSAFEANRSLFCPPQTVKRATEHTGRQTELVMLGWFKQFENPNGAIAAIHDLRARISFNIAPKALEHALLELAPLLGAEGTRPEEEFGEGPDDLWLWSDTSWVVEVKNQNEESLHKKDAGQLLLSLQWFSNAYPTRPEAAPVIVAKNTAADRLSDFPDGTRVLTPSCMAGLLDALEKLYAEMLRAPLLITKPPAVRPLLDQLGLAPQQLLGRYTKQLRGRK
ncbi:MAG: DEAD/DEAH box helicase family protein [Planctomycetes bacterium]|nr:DEAD/DEAH box helicase family protein [Planctomycetota bacterium]